MKTGVEIWLFDSRDLTYDYVKSHEKNVAQSYNRYSYCWNNPLKFVDPSGYYTIDIDGLQFQAHSLGYLAGVFGNDNVESIFSRGYDNKPIQWREVVNSYTYYDPIPKWLGSGESINDYRHTVTNRYYYAIMGLEGENGNAGSTLADAATGTDEINYPAKIDFSRSDYLKQMQNTFYWFQTLPITYPKVLVDNLIDYDKLKESPYFYSSYSAFGLYYHSNSNTENDPIVSLVHPQTYLIPEVSIINYSNVNILYTRSSNGKKIASYSCPSGIRNGNIFITVRSMTQSDVVDGERNVGITINFNVGNNVQWNLFKDMNRNLGGVIQIN